MPKSIFELVVKNMQYANRLHEVEQQNGSALSVRGIVRNADAFPSEWSQRICSPGKKHRIATLEQVRTVFAVGFLRVCTPVRPHCYPEETAQPALEGGELRR